jgi:hypothetical protein
MHDRQNLRLRIQIAPLPTARTVYDAIGAESVSSVGHLDTEGGPPLEFASLTKIKPR